MLTAVPDPVPPTGWVQVIGRVAVHVSEDELHRLTGSGQRLLAVLVAAGPEGATAEKIADEIWGDTQPDPWRPALRMAVARLRKQLPENWEIVSGGGSYRIDAHDGWVDAWRLEDIASSRSFIIEDDLIWMLAGQPFGDVDLLEMVAGSTQNLQMLQITVAELFCAQEPASMSPATCTALTSLLREHPYNDRLAVVIADALAAADRRNEALVALTAFSDTYASEFGAVAGEVSRFLSSGGERAPVESLAALAQPPLDEVLVAKELRHLIDDPMLGRAAELARLQASKGALVTGVTGSGKSRLLAALAMSDRVTDTTYVVGDDRLDLPLGPFAVAIPTLRDELLASGADQSEASGSESSAERAVSTRAWRIVLAHLESRSASRPQRLVVDDAHLLDPASLGLLRLLIRSNTASDLTFIVCGRGDYDDAEWADLMRDAERAGLDPIQLQGLGLDELALMVYEQFPDATRQARRGLARDVQEVSDGLPAVAAPMIAAADPETLALPEQLPGASAISRVTASFSERAPEVVAAAAVLGHQFSIGALIALAETDESSVFGVLDELWTSGLIVETDDPDEVRFRHVLIQRAFLDSVPLFRRGQLHRRAGELTEDVHARADHQANASALVPSEVAAASLMASAQLYADKRQWRKVARELRRIDELPGDLLDAAALTLWAAALDQSGADGSVCRRQAYDMAAEQHDWASALEAALSGLPEAELPDGDAERVEMLKEIPASQLESPRRFDRLFHLSRQYSLMAQHAQALDHADQAMQAASSPDQLALSHILRWTATRHVDAIPHWIPVEVADGAGLRILTRLAHINALNLAEAGDTDSARVGADRFSQLASELGDPLRIWHAQGLQGMFPLNDGDFETTEAMALQNFQFAELHDIQQGAAAYIGQRVFAFDCQDRLAELQPELDPFRANLSQIFLGRAALTLCDEAAGHSANVADEVSALLRESLDRGRQTYTLLTMLFLARFVPRHAPDMIPEIEDVLERFEDRPILAGFGVGSFGPTTRYIAQLTADLTRKRELAAQSVAAADRHGPRLWRVRCRLDAADLGDEQALIDAAEIAAGTGLAAVVRRRAAQLGRHL